MRVTVLIVIFNGEEFITVHDSPSAASDALKEFIEGRWSDRFGEDYSSVSLSDEERARRFFAADGNIYILGEADLSEIADHIDTILER